MGKNERRYGEDDKPGRDSSYPKIGLGTAWSPQRFRELVNDPQYTTVMLATAVFFLMSILIHFPTNHSPQYYSDFMDSFFARTTPSGLKEVVVGIPYVTYMFEYPTVCGLIVWLGGWASGGNPQIFAAVEFGILLIFALVSSHFVYQFLGYLGLPYRRQLIYSVFAPSILFYGAYNFDIVQSAFVVVSLYFFMARRNMKVSAIALGLAAATKLSPILLTPLFWQELPTNRKRALFTAWAGGTFAALNVPYMIINFNVWLQGYDFLKNWGLEDAFLVWIFPNQVWWWLAKDISLVLVAASAVLIYVFMRRKSLIERTFLILGSFILFSYIAVPQANLDILPLFALLPAAIPITLFYLFELSDVGIIVTWFEFANPTLPGVTQTFALIRQIYLGVIMILVAISKQFKGLV